MKDSGNRLCYVSLLTGTYSGKHYAWSNKRLITLNLKAKKYVACEPCNKMMERIILYI